MSQKIYGCTLIVLGILLIMIGEYRYIMHNMHVSVDDSIVYVEIFGQVDAYMAEMEG